MFTEDCVGLVVVYILVQDGSSQQPCLSLAGNSHLMKFAVKNLRLFAGANLNSFAIRGTS